VPLEKIYADIEVSFDRHLRAFSISGKVERESYALIRFWMFSFESDALDSERACSRDLRVI